MKRYLAVLALVLASACAGVHIHPVPRPQPPVIVTPPVVAPAETASMAIVATSQGQPVRDSRIAITPNVTTYAPTNSDGYSIQTIPLGTYTVTVTADGYVPITFDVTVRENVDVPVKLTPIRPPDPTEAEFHRVLTNFCNLHDKQGRVIFTAMYAGLDDESRKDWLDRLVAAGSTHVAISPAAGYPGSPIPAFDIYSQPDRFASFVREILRTPGANGKALTPILILDGGDPGIRQRIDAFWPAIRGSLGDDADRVIVVPGWELINASPTTSAEFSYALTKLHDLGYRHIWAHLSPGRASASSNPVEPDDPWQGAESGMWKSNGGQWVEGLLYQSQAVRGNDDQCDPADDGCFLNRWEDVVPRIAAGMNGWRILGGQNVGLVFFEGPAYYFYRGQVDSAFARRIATAAQRMCEKYRVECGFGNGLPVK